MRAKHGWRSKYAFGQRIHAGRTCLFSGWAVFLCFALAGGGRQGENRTQRCGLRNEVWFSASTFRTLFLRSGRAQVTEIAEIVAIPSSAVTTSRAELAGISFFFLNSVHYVHGLGRCSRTTNPAWLLGLGAHLIRLDSAICPFRRRVLPRGTD